MDDQERKRFTLYELYLAYIVGAVVMAIMIAICLKLDGVL